MTTQEYDRYIHDAAEFRGYVVAKLESFEKFTVAFEKHTEDEMATLEKMNDRLRELENWKLKVMTLSSAVGALVGFLTSTFFP